jgi:chitin disaccharide deacetylase
MTPTRLIVNADDCGMSRGITDAIVLAHRYGFLTSTSLMANMPAADYAISRVVTMPTLGLGVHLNICTGRPILSAREIPTLVAANGDFHPPAVMIRRLWTWRASGREIEAEFRAQIQWMKARGISPTHADSHHHMHIYPAAVAPFARALAAEGIRCARAPRSSVWPRNGQIGGPHEGPLLRRVFVQSYRAALQLGVFRNLDMPASRISFLSRDRHNPASLGERWKNAIASLPAGTFELACHPGLFERGFSETDAIRTQREQELEWLTGREWIDAVRQSGVRLITYRDLSDRPAANPAHTEAPVLQ